MLHAAHASTTIDNSFLMMIWFCFGYDDFLLANIAFFPHKSSILRRLFYANGTFEQQIDTESKDKSNRHRA
jgi:hypothetical protein